MDKKTGAGPIEGEAARFTQDPDALRHLDPALLRLCGVEIAGSDGRAPQPIDGALTGTEAARVILEAAVGMAADGHESDGVKIRLRGLLQIFQELEEEEGVDILSELPQADRRAFLQLTGVKQERLPQCVGKRVDLLRAETDLDQQDIATMMGASVNTVSRFLNGVTHPNVPSMLLPTLRLIEGAGRRIDPEEVKTLIADYLWEKFQTERGKYEHVPNDEVVRARCEIEARQFYENLYAPLPTDGDG